MKHMELLRATAVVALMLVLSASALADINRFSYYPFNSLYKAVPDSGAPNWYTMNFDGSLWPYVVATTGVEEYPVLSPSDPCCPTGYFRGELNFTYRDIASSYITGVYVWLWANTEFDLWFNDTYIGGEHAWPTGPPMAFDIASLFNAHGKNVIAIRAEVPGSNPTQIHGTIIVEYSMPVMSLAAVKGQGDIQQGDLLGHSYPNPFGTATSIAYRLEQSKPVRVTIYNAMGQVVRTLIDEEVAAGEHKVVWDGRDNQGHSVAPGSYFYELSVDGSRQAKKAIRLR